jgi:DNA-nicking Smr family endonuclease
MSDRTDDEPLTAETGVAESASTSIEPVEIQITDVLDLHPFQPRDVSSVVREYLDAASEAGLKHLRIVHGRGKGVQRNTVRTLLARDSRVASFGDAPLEAGGWGATWVEFEYAEAEGVDAEGVSEG